MPIDKKKSPGGDQTNQGKSKKQATDNIADTQPKSKGDGQKKSNGQGRTRNYGCVV